LTWVCIAVVTLSSLQVALKFLSLRLNRKNSHDSRVQTRPPTMPSSENRHCHLDTDIDAKCNLDAAVDPCTAATSSASTSDAFRLNVVDSLDEDIHIHNESEETAKRSRTNPEAIPNKASAIPSVNHESGMYSCRHLVQTILHVFEVALTYCLMLLFMTFNLWVCLAVVLGAGLGHFLFAWSVGRPMVNRPK
ncbi:high affinity copper uptake protein 1, partial [Elysia marginata]